MIEQEKMIVEALPSLYPLQKFEEDAVHAVIDALPHWIPVTERLPEPRIDVWCNSDLGQMVGYYDEMIETWFGRDYLELLVNAWMPLPEPFKGVTE